MATANFYPMLYGMPMVCGGTVAQRYKAIEEMFGMSVEDIEAEGWLDTALYIVDEDECKYAQELADEINKSLVFHKITLDPGYYDSFQFWVAEQYADWFDLDKTSTHCISNEDAHEYYGMCRSAVLRKADAEKRRIRNWLYSLRDKGFNVVVCTGRFSDGSATYSVADGSARVAARAC